MAMSGNIDVIFMFIYCTSYTSLYTSVLPCCEVSALDCLAGSEGTVSRCASNETPPLRRPQKQTKLTTNCLFKLKLQRGNPIRVKSNSPGSSSNSFICDATISLASGASGVC